MALAEIWSWLYEIHVDRKEGSWNSSHSAERGSGPRLQMVRKGQKWECPAGNHNQKHLQSTHKECRNSGLLAIGINAVWLNTFLGWQFCTGKKKQSRSGKMRISTHCLGCNFQWLLISRMLVPGAYTFHMLWGWGPKHNQAMAGKKLYLTMFVPFSFPKIM